ncbi:hypothetical protein DACRYDRAFT_22905 [Dacryopinax primogenitus]|uniref:Mitochondrial carrier n=1 Tax=Dacryopinax primogenitus (strain DJM 731) TaxID=1858805 RepID=M5FTY2_DACPD|nr:uncharacterized protein DACRYDRAFT_22905 [Dacryopinax primogenitus]EJU01131.1 hypothetical protein DACRYDRAFT_22905 [Dacryopinax primogenitus]
MSNPSLRHGYHPSSSSWTFDTPTNAVSGSFAPPATSPRVELPLPNAAGAFSDIDASTWPRKILTLLLIQYASTAIAMPFEGAKVLSQVEWIPRDGVAEWVDEEVEDERDDASDASDTGPSYFYDPSPNPIAHPFTRRTSSMTVRRRSSTRPTPMNVGIYRRPPWVLPPFGDPGVWGMIKRTMRTRTEGVYTLWNGQLPSTTIDILTSTVQPFLHTILASIPFLAAAPPDLLLGPAPIPLVLSHVMTGVLLIPLDHLRTHLILNPSSRSLPPDQRTTPPPRLYFSSLMAQYMHPHLLLPALLTSSIPHVLSLCLPRLLPPSLTPTLVASPVLQPILSLVFTAASLLITLPLETVKRRLQAQTALNLVDPPPVTTSEDDHTPQLPQHRVLTRPMPYHGIIDTLYRIMSEESSVPPPLPEHREKAATSFWTSTVIRQLYRGYGMALTAGVIVFCLGLLGGDLDEPGWAEL